MPAKYRHVAAGFTSPRANIFHVLTMASFHLGKRLRVQIEMAEGEGPFLGNKRAALFPPFSHRDEISR